MTIQGFGMPKSSALVVYKGGRLFEVHLLVRHTSRAQVNYMVEHNLRVCAETAKRALLHSFNYVSGIKRIIDAKQRIDVHIIEYKIVTFRCNPVTNETFHTTTSRNKAGVVSHDRNVL